LAGHEINVKELFSMLAFTLRVVKTPAKLDKRLATEQIMFQGETLVESDSNR
jgi:hypothetical protein